MNGGFALLLQLVSGVRYREKTPPLCAMRRKALHSECVWSPVPGTTHASEFASEQAGEVAGGQGSSLNVGKEPVGPPHVLPNEMSGCG